MTLPVLRLILLPSCFSKSCLLVVRATSFIKQTITKPVNSGNVIHSFRGIQVLCSKMHMSPCVRFSTVKQPEKICWEGSSHDVLLNKLETALKVHRVGEAWEAYSDFKNLYGFPNHCLISRLIIELSYSSDAHWLQKAFNMVLVILKEKPDLLHHDLLIKLSFSLARAQMPIPTSTILRLVLEKNKFPPINIWQMIFLHMVKTEIGTYLASNILVEVCDCSIHCAAKTSNYSKLMNPDTMIFNLVLDACVRFQLTLMGQQIIELMAQMRVIADAGSIVLIAQIYELNGQREEVKKFKVHIDSVLSTQFVSHYRLFYDGLLNLHFKFNDIDAAAGLVLDLCKCQRFLHGRSQLIDDKKKLCSVSIGSHNLRNGLRMKIEPELLQKDFVFKQGSQSELIMFKNGKLILSNKGIAKFINGYKREGRICDLSKLLMTIQEELGFSGNGFCSDVIDACIHLGWLETAHDILHDMELAGVPLSSTIYMSLLRAYYQGNMYKEAKSLRKQMNKASLQVNLYVEKTVSTCHSEQVYLPPNKGAANANRKLALAESLIREMREEEKTTPSLVYEIDSSIYFFCKAKMIEDAIKSYRKMKERKIQPTLNTFVSLVNGYYLLGMYREITILWGDMKRCMDSGHVMLNWDFYEFLLWNFIRGGYFERAMEIIGLMRKHGIYIDKWKYKREFIRFHKNLYRNLKASKAKTEAQSKRLEYVRAFRKWVGTD